MNNWKWDNPCALGDQVDSCTPQTTSVEKVDRTGARFCWYGRDDLRPKIEPPSCQQYKPGHFLALRPLDWDEIMNEVDGDENWANRAAPSGGRCCPSEGNDHYDREGEEDTLGGEKGPGKEKGRKAGKGKGKGKWQGKRKAMEEGKGKGDDKGKGNVEQTPGEDDISCAVALQLQKEMYEADSDTEG
jgi:hypothetical protein